MQRTLVFDLDGTLAETAGDLNKTLNHILAREGLPPVSLAAGREMVGAGAKALIRAGFEQGKAALDEERLEQLFHDYLAHYEAHIADETYLYDGVMAALDRFGQAGWRLAVCTNKIEASSRQLLGALGVAERFAAICGQDTHKVDGIAICKPDPRALTLTIAQAGGSAGRTVMVGDSKTDIATAQAAGVPVVAVDFGYTDRPVSHFNPDRVISHFDALWDAVQELEGRFTA